MARTAGVGAVRRVEGGVPDWRAALTAAALTSFLVRARLVRRAAHIAFIRRNLFEARGSVSLDSGRPWFVYWSLQALTRLGADVSADESRLLADFLRRCQAPSGGFGGGRGQLPHLAPSFAAVSALVILGGEYAYSVIDRCAMLNMRLKSRPTEWRADNVSARIAAMPVPQAGHGRLAPVAAAAGRLVLHARRRRGGHPVSAQLNVDRFSFR